mmetsp:Transcript_21438/g.29789  ORF Transcript_21438/g.29789 Transcript_21438/m.29789 type:complete len:621 (-) Transcript_21438:127-1989(-)|eukprot:CAMPEP_0196587418 /NCGR_PEP_ID=MMETSP1081-20130531/57416_1 /TAXON_ID=36882 /ORGANISM="Pyramimonas amylifera, Strain CCMP720" /LENGTH=620 /DNA_ID=CAMNT_0041909601 /DNA_START=124 /DNA_END=1986 /DNA_ORIENTATION=+
MIGELPLPKLPGCSFQDPRAPVKKKSQTLNYVNGYAVPSDPVSNGQSNASAPFPDQSNSTGTIHESGPALETLPAWVAYDRKVLRFQAYFKEAVVESSAENHRIRKCIIYLYLEDDSIHVAEPKQQNSGIPQGVFLKRHRVPREGSSGYFSIEDLNVGVEVTFYARTFHIVSCDPFTRTFLTNSGVSVPGDCPFPSDPIDSYRDSFKKLRSGGAPNPRYDDLTRFIEAKLGKATNALNPDKLQKFIANDRKVLRFFCLWDDRDALYGDRRPYVLHYFLCDDTVEILEVNEPNSGRDPFPVFLKRGPLPNKPIEVDALGPTKTYTYYTAADFMVGSHIVIYGRNMFIHDCDEFTRQHLAQAYGYDQLDMSRINVSEPEDPLPQMELPPHNGFGSMLDTTQNCTSLIPKPPKKDLHKIMMNEKKILRFNARMVEIPGRPPMTNADLDRRFIVQFFLSDDTIMIFEPPTRNSGIIGGKFLERMAINKEGTNDAYKPGELYAGAHLFIHRRCFELVEGDDYTYGYMEDHCQLWPFSDMQQVTKHLRGAASAEGAEDKLRTSFISVDTEGRGLLGAGELLEALTTAGVEVAAQEVITIVRALDDTGDGKVSVEKFFDQAFGLKFS